MKFATKVVLAAVLFWLLMALVTPWLVNQRSTLTLIATPFAWLAYGSVVYLMFFCKPKK